jgi:hypothetical protein
MKSTLTNTISFTNREAEVLRELEFFWDYEIGSSIQIYLRSVSYLVHKIKGRKSTFSSRDTYMYPFPTFRFRALDGRLETGANYVPGLLYLAEWLESV